MRKADDNLRQSLSPCLSLSFSCPLAYIIGGRCASQIRQLRRMLSASRTVTHFGALLAGVQSRHLHFVQLQQIR